jgi:perosamine synthetase
MNDLMALAEKRGIKVIEDTAEALGGTYLGRPCGTLAHVACFSFYGNKVMTTGEGGMLVTNDEVIARRARLLRGQGQDPNRRYFHIEVGFNYRLTNVQSAIGCAQLEQLDEFLTERGTQFLNYRRLLEDSSLEFNIPEPLPGCVQAPWLFTLLLPDDLQAAREQVIAQMLKEDVETRPTFEVAYRMPPYAGMKRIPEVHEHSERISNSGISLPTFPGLTLKQQVTVIDSLKRTAMLFRDRVPVIGGAHV